MLNFKACKACTNAANCEIVAELERMEREIADLDEKYENMKPKWSRSNLPTLC